MDGSIDVGPENRDESMGLFWPAAVAVAIYYAPLVLSSFLYSFTLSSFLSQTSLSAGAFVAYLAACDR